MISDEEARENINRFGWSLPYPKIEEPDEKLDRLYGDNEDYNHFKDVCYQYGYDHKCLVTNDNLKKIYGKDMRRSTPVQAILKSSRWTPTEV